MAAIGWRWAAAPMRAGARALRFAIDLALPPRCPGCGIVTADDGRFCLDCWQTLDFLAGPGCAQCGERLGELAPAGSRCGRCLADPPAFDRVSAAFAYGDVARAVALKLKHGHRPMLARTLARTMARLAPELPPDALLVPVPLHRWRLWRRGYNQAALIAGALGRIRGLPVDPALLERHKPTPMLRGLGRRERAKAVRGAFRLGAAASIRGRTIVLVDDVLTSGATANACARVLKRGGAARVELLCWARVIADAGEALR